MTKVEIIQLMVYEDGFLSFLIAEKGEIVLSDLIPYQIGDKVTYNPSQNSTTGSVDYLLNHRDNTM